MKRRNVLATLGTLSAGGAFTVGSGAFTSVSAKRAVTVEVVDDDRAYLRLEPLEYKGLDSDSDGSRELTGRSFTNGGQVQFELPGYEDGENLNTEGLGLDSTYEFHDLLKIVNQGTQPVEIYSSYDGTAVHDLALVRDNGVLRNDPPTLDVGEHLGVGLYIDTHGSSIGEYDETLTIVADQP
ncbi:MULTISPECIES: hypothetical protein [Salinibaculum]|uniref:hypothetical protein n=1 Tax=Salinibaculum TaxID=2732368 RepID=UPI0030D1B1BE